MLKKDGGFARALMLAALLVTAPAQAEDHGHGAVADDYAEEFQGFVPGAQRLEGRIRAPCCWNQTLDIHGSEISNGLRREIRRRLLGGETSDAIEADIVTRYGERVLAVAPHSPLKKLAVFMSVGMGIAGVGAVAMLVRWRRRNKLPQPSSRAKEPAPAKRDELDDRLDAELGRDD